MPDIALDFREPDAASLPELVRCLDALAALPAFRAYKAASWAALAIADGALILDVGCGAGFDLIEMAKRWPAARFIGLDRSAGFIALARARAARLANVGFVHGDAGALPFAATAFDGARVDRSLQHIAEPRRAVAEMARVVRRGGRLVASEPDWGTFVLYNGDRAVGDALCELWRGSIRNPFIGRELMQMLRDCGAAPLGCAVAAFHTADYASAAQIFDLARLLERAGACGLMSATAADGWREAAEAAARAGVFFAALNIVTASGAAA